MKKNIFDEYLKSIASIELEIRDYVKKVHDDVNQKYGDKSYFYHLDKVARLTEEYVYSIIRNENDILPVIFGAYFHDSIEDARLTYNDVKKIAKKWMTDYQALMAAEIVYALTNEKGRNRAERANEKYYEEIRNTPYVPLIKACDRLANINFNSTYDSEQAKLMFKCHTKEMPEFINHINVDYDASIDNLEYTLPSDLKNKLLSFC